MTINHLLSKHSYNLERKVMARDIIYFNNNYQIGIITFWVKNNE